MKWMHCFVLCIIIISSSFGQDELSEIDTEQIVQTENYGSHLKFEPLALVSNYTNDFEKENNDFITSNFKISDIPKIEGQVLQTPHPYPTSLHPDSTFNLIAYLKHPVILESVGFLQFDEIVLVEPEKSSTKSGTNFSGDFVLIEASHDYGKTWHALTEKYNSGVDAVWEHIFLNSIINSQSYATGTQSIFKKRSINLIDNINFFEGDTIFVRFRLCSDHTINGWGWAIDNLEIKQEVNVEKSLFSENFNIYPNPCKDQLYVDCSNIYGPDKVDIILTNQSGITIHRENQVPVESIKNKNIDFSNLSPGIYMLIITDQNFYRKTKKIIKN